MLRLRATELKEINSELDNLSILRKLHDEKLKELHGAFFKNYARKSDGFIYITVTHQNMYDYDNNYIIGACFDNNEIDSEKYSYVHRVENVAIIESLLHKMLKFENHKYIKSYSLQNLINIIKKVCICFDGSISSFLDEYIQADILANDD